ncbi:MAG: DMT family transporter, partial [Pseudomonadota bacterium]
MRAKPDLDAAGIVWLTAFSALMGFNQVLVKVMNGALQPVFNAGLRSLLALGLLGVWIVLMRKTWRIAPSARPWAILVGAFFAGEFICLFVALDLTSVARASVMFYTMPVWLTLMAHVAVPGERLSTTKVIGQALALAGVVWALFDRDTGSQGSVTGDLLALGGAV